MRAQTLCCTLCCAAACTLLLHPAWAQQPVEDGDRASMRTSSTGPAVSLLLRAASSNQMRAERSAVVTGRASTRTVLEDAADARRATFGRRVGTLAATLVDVLAAQNALSLDAPGEQDAYLRPPKRGETGRTGRLFTRAKQLYDDVTSYGTERYDLSIDPLGLKCSLRFSLGRILSGPPAADGGSEPVQRDVPGTREPDASQLAGQDGAGSARAPGVDSPPIYD